jgi:hypothetical protein
MVVKDRSGAPEGGKVSGRGNGLGGGEAARTPARPATRASGRRLTGDGDRALKGVHEALFCKQEGQQERAERDEHHDRGQPPSQDLHLDDQVRLGRLDLLIESHIRGASPIH